MKMENLTRALLWRVQIEGPEMIEAPNYYRDYLGFKEISQKDLNTICEIGNVVFERLGSHLRLANSMGEIIPTEAVPFG